MKKIYFLILFVVGLSAHAAPGPIDHRNPFGYGDAFIFNEGGVEFAIFPDGQFDFFFDPRGARPRFAGRDPFSFNHGFNYDPFVQYDDFGAVVQIERVPIFYDFYGRIVRAGNVPIFYNQFGTVSRIGNLYLEYDRYGRYVHHSGLINRYNRFYSYRPWHEFYRRPPMYSVVVYNQPYRAHYYPQRYDYIYYKNHYDNMHKRDFRRSYYRPGEKVTTYHRGRRTEARQDQNLYEFENDVRSNMNSEKERPADVRAVRRTNTEIERHHETQSRNRAAPVPQSQQIENSVQERSSATRATRTSVDSVKVPVQSPEKVSERGTRSSRGRN